MPKKSRSYGTYVRTLRRRRFGGRSNYRILSAFLYPVKIASNQFIFQSFVIQKPWRCHYSIARGTGGLEKIQLGCEHRPLGVFNELVARNKSLRCVKIHVSDARSWEDSIARNEQATDIVKTFMKFQSLKALEVMSYGYPSEEPIPRNWLSQRSRRAWVCLICADSFVF